MPSYGLDSTALSARLGGSQHPMRKHTLRLRPASSSFLGLIPLSFFGLLVHTSIPSKPSQTTFNGDITR